MPKYDAFGREIGEDTLAGLGGGEQPPAEPAASVSSAPQVPIAPPPAPSAPVQRPSVSIPSGVPRAGRRNRSGLGCLVSLVILAAVIVGPIIAIVSFVGEVGDDVQQAIDDATTGVPGTESAPPPSGLGGRSMLREENLAPALRRIRGLSLGGPGTLVIYADRVNVTLVKHRSSTRNVVVTYEGELRRGELTNAGVPQDTLSWGEIDPAVPEKLARAAAKAIGARPGNINYVIGGAPAFGGGGVHWIAYFKNGKIVEGNGKGRPTRRIQ